MLCLSIFFCTPLYKPPLPIHIQEMDATNLFIFDDDEEDYIDLELTSTTSPQSTEFEFQMSAAAAHTETATSPADELFYKGKLLPLHLPRRRQMVQNLLFQEASNLSPSESCRVSCDDLNSDDDFFEWSKEIDAFINIHPTKITWPNKLKSYLKSFFIKSRDSSTKLSVEKLMNNNGKRRSFSSAVKRHSPTKCLSSTSSDSSSGSSSFSNANLHDLHFLRRSSSATEIERSIEGAIAHCKKSRY